MPDIVPSVQKTLEFYNWSLPFLLKYSPSYMEGTILKQPLKYLVLTVGTEE